MYAQTERFSAIRQMEFALLRLIKQLDELYYAIQSAIHGSLSITLIKPTVLLNTVEYQYNKILETSEINLL